MHDELESAHGDIKGQNIMLTYCGRVKLIDFGFSGPPGSSQQCGTTGVSSSKRHTHILDNLYTFI